ncbi:hypothetical protein [Longimicrobium terrae]|uniref:Uncharacterized protein n=1 Tax=Longimicrobium terrae TaxID=1639882 RepID=A0A841GIV2_9BACT|nr:hypothetical protein [Longimicrobium terrae]MBB4634633.1 hypothetical protein [Longimicrobium terrae]MBB6068477.1 hypothetical protein [Longimicrobium terrae]NNC27670.1 hypothetical protein [Longimicrobium terrae]
MRKLLLNLEALNVQSFQVASEGGAVGTVKAASDGTYPSDACPAIMMLSECASACMQSGIRPCIATQNCC